MQSTKKTTKQELPIESEYYIFAFQYPAETKDLNNVCAVASIGKLTDEQASFVRSEFKRDCYRWFCFRFISKQSIPTDNGLQSKLLRDNVEKLLQHENFPGQRTMDSTSLRSIEKSINVATDIANRIRMLDNCEHWNVVREKPVATPPTDTAEIESAQMDVVDLIAKMKGRWVSQGEYLDKNINADRHKFTKTSLFHSRETGKVVWSIKTPMIGKDDIGNFLERTGKNRWSYKYRYFLQDEFNKTITSNISDEKVVK